MNNSRQYSVKYGEFRYNGREGGDKFSYFSSDSKAVEISHQQIYRTLAECIEMMSFKCVEW